jgi:hypothetical protein
MSNKKPRGPSIAENLDRAFVDNILAMSEEQLNEELSELGVDPAGASGRAKAALARAVALQSKAALTRAKEGLASFKANQDGFRAVQDRAALVLRLQKMKLQRSESADDMMLAARKGAGLSDQDIDGILEDLQDLEKLGPKPNTK